MIPTVKNFRDFLGYGVPPNDAGKGWVVNVDQKGTLSRRSWVAWGSRDEKMLKANGNARQAFVTALKNEFNVTKLSDIPKSVQQVLKIGDFELDENDSVKSVKPLTAYRIRCIVTQGARFALNALVNPRGGIVDRLQEDPAHPFTGAISKICLAIREFGNATTDEARKRACETIAGQIDVFVRGLSGWAQGEFADNLDSRLRSITPRRAVPLRKVS